VSNICGVATELELITNSLPDSVKTYLRLLGRSDAVQNLLPKLVSPRNPDLIADLELAGGWSALRLALFPPEGTRAKGYV
jgi:hypothetical protein